MAISAQLQTALDALNPEQLDAVNSIDGTVLVVAGPGTGKTQLLSLRVANILEQRDISPANILCLTFTKAGAEAMQERLAGFIGRAAYAVEISTFHSFGGAIRSNYPEYFERGTFDKQISDLQKKKLVEGYLEELDYTDPLFQNPYAGNYRKLSAVVGLLGNFKRAGLTPAQLREIFTQNLTFFEYAEQQTDLLSALDFKLVGKGATDLIDGVANQVSQLVASAPAALKTSIVETAGIYTPYVNYLDQLFSQTELYSINADTGRMSTKGFSDLRKLLFVRDNGRYLFKDKAANEELISVVRIYEQYTAHLAANALFDYDDMILDTAIAIEENPRLKQILQEQYQYILVDEFQDTNGSQMRLVDLISGHADEPESDPNLLVVGDDDQSIMRFQGASVEFINQFESRYRGTKRIVLKTNYRSTPSLVALGQAVAEQIANRSPASSTEKLLTAHKTESQPAVFTIAKYPDKEVQYFEVARAIRAKLDAGFLQNAKKPDEAIAVIAKKHKSLRNLIPYLNQQEVAFNYVINTAVSQIPSLQTLFEMLNFAVDYARLGEQDADAHLPRILAAEELGFAVDDYFDFALQIKRAKHPRPSWAQSLQRSSDPRKVDLINLLLEAAKDSLIKPARQVINKLAQPLASYYQQNQAAGAFDAIEFNYGLKELLRFAQDEHDGIKRLGAFDHPLLLAELVALLNDADRFSVDLSINVPVDRPSAITLTTAHKSKGLEYDLVYIVDSDESSWKAGGVDAVKLSQNMLIKSAGDDDDARRTLFVAITRARYQLELSYASDKVVAELFSEVQEVAPSISEAQVAALASTTWQENYYPQSPELLARLLADTNNRTLSVSALNKFVRYDKGDSKSSGYVLEKLVGLPSESVLAMDFGNTMHAFFESYIKLNAADNQEVAARIIKQCTQEIAYLDYSEPELANLQKRFGLIVEHFLPKFKQEFLAPDVVLQSEQWVNCELDGVALTGKCDLLVFDQADHSIKVLDFKTGKPKENPDAIFRRDYNRQLQFYKLLIESSEQYQGWQVSAGADIYIEPQKPDWALAEPKYLSPGREDLEHLRALIKAAWWRIQNGRFDTSSFDTSEQLAELLTNSVYKTGEKAGQPKTPEKQEFQVAFELWLIADYQMALEKNGNLR